jgi:hypothetical protein
VQPFIKCDTSNSAKRQKLFKNLFLLSFRFVHLRNATLPILRKYIDFLKTFFFFFLLDSSIDMSEDDRMPELLEEEDDDDFENIPEDQVA